MIKQDNAPFQVAANCFPPLWRERLLSIPEKYWGEIQEIRLLRDRPLLLVGQGKLLFSCGIGYLSEDFREGNWIVTKEEIQECFRGFCNFSVHTHQEEIRQGFLSIQGGHRVGIGGTAVYSEGKLIGMRDITSLNFRIARMLYHSADELLPKLFGNGLCSVIIAGPPASGKTTLLRSLAHSLSSGQLGKCHKVAIVDERFELCGLDGVFGPCCDILSGFRKAEGILQAVRTLSPEIIICDEVGTIEEVQAIQASLNCGVCVVTSMHSASFDELARKKQYQIITALDSFQKAVILKDSAHPGEVDKLVLLERNDPERQEKRQFIVDIKGDDVQ